MNDLKDEIRNMRADLNMVKEYFDLQEKFDRKIRFLRDEMKAELEKEIRRTEQSLIKDIKNHFYLLIVLFFVLVIKVLSMSVH